MLSVVHPALQTLQSSVLQDSEAWTWVGVCNVGGLDTKQPNKASCDMVAVVQLCSHRWTFSLLRKSALILFMQGEHNKPLVLM